MTSYLKKIYFVWKIGISRGKEINYRFDWLSCEICGTKVKNLNVQGTSITTPLTMLLYETFVHLG